MAKYSLFLAAALCCAIAASQLNGADQAASASSPASQAGAERIKSLISKLGDTDSAVRDAAQQELVRIGPAAMDALVQAAKDPDAEIRSSAAEILRQVRASAALAASKEMAKNYLWSSTIESGTIGSPAVFGDRLYVVGGDWRLYAINLKTGRKVWDVDHQGKGMFALGAGEKGVAFIQGAGLAFHDAKDGKEVWRKDVPGAAGPGGGPAIGGGAGRFPIFVPSQAWVMGGTVIAKATDGLRAFKAADGADDWQVELKLAGRPCMAAMAGGIACMSSGQAVVGVDLATHKQIWSHEVADTIVLGANGKVFCGVAGPKVFALDPQKGGKLWEADMPADTRPRVASGPAPVRHPGPLVMDDQRLYIVFGSQEFMTYDLKTGAMAAVAFDPSLVEAAAREMSGGADSRNVPRPAGKSVLSLGASRNASGGVLYVSGNDALLAFDGKTGRNLWMLPVKHPISGSMNILDGVLYFVTLRGLSKTPDTGPAPLPKDTPGVHALKLPS
ncbi:MAG: PQQ-binding-like beta-propeller repeat protein [Phycisphaerae bacterium]